MGNVLNRAGLVALTLGLSFVAQGATIHDNGGPNQMFGVNMSNFIVAENFNVAVASDITNIRFWSIQLLGPDYLGNVFWAVYGNAAGQPGSVVAGNLTPAVTPAATGNSTSLGYDEYLFNIPVAFQLTAGTYWLGLSNSPLDLVTPTEMLWTTTSGGNGSEAKYLDGTWQDSGQQLAFRIDGDPSASGAIPEPATYILFAGGLAAAALLRRKTI